jgi:hypothetical protein
MKRINFFALMIFSLSSASLYEQKGKFRLVMKADTIKRDSVEYELLIFDPGFDSWPMTKPSRNFPSKSYYEIKNLLYVTELFSLFYVVRLFDPNSGKKIKML